MFRVGYNADFAPFSLKKGGIASGIVIDRIRTIFKKADIPFEFVACELKELTKGLLSGEFDMLAALAKTSARTGLMSFTRPIIVSGAAWFAPRDRPAFSGNNLPHRVVTPKTGPLVAQIHRLYPQIEIITSDDYERSLQDVLYNKSDIDAAALNWHVGRMLIEEKYKSLFHIPGKPFYSIPICMAAKLDKLNTIIGQLNNHIPDDWGYNMAKD